jgi:Cu/Ag efflux protein CusF
VYHEPIDNFVGADGKVVGMGTMTMPFPLAKGVSLEGLSVGDIVEVTFEVRWKSHPRTQTTKVVKLPAGTELHFGKAKR